MKELYNEYVSEIIPNLFQGSWHATNPVMLEHHQIDNIVHIGFTPNLLCASRHYDELMIDDNPQNALKFIDEIIPDLIGRIKSQIDEDKRVLICCSAGRSRSISVVIAYLMKYDRMNCDEALEFIKTKRPFANPNQGFLRSLRRAPISKKDSNIS